MGLEAEPGKGQDCCCPCRGHTCQGATDPSHRNHHSSCRDAFPDLLYSMHNSDLLQSQKSLRNCISRMITALMLKPSATIKNRALPVFLQKGMSQDKDHKKSGLVQQHPGLIQAKRHHASSCSHQGRFILQNWKCIFRIELGKCRFRRRASMPWQDHHGICRTPSNRGVS